jgi:Ni,Fe-hydrogenase III small subunit
VLLFSKIWKTGVVTEPLQAERPEMVELARELDRKSRALLGRALAIRAVDAGSCNGCEIEIAGLASPVYDMERFGMHFVASPRHADLLLVTGPVTRNMEVPLRKTYEATPDPKFVVATGDCARTCGVFQGAYGVVGPVDAIIPVDVFVAGCPPEPQDILAGILHALDRIAHGQGASRSGGIGRTSRPPEGRHYTVAPYDGSPVADGGRR